MAIPILLSVISVFWLFFIYSGLGYFLFKLLGFSFQSCLLRILTGTALGFCIIGNAIMVLCFVQQASSLWIISLLLLFTLIGLPFSMCVISDSIYVMKQSISLLKNSPRAASCLLIILIGGYAVRGLLPPTGFDALMYHLSTIKLYLEHGGFWNIYFNTQSDYPMLTEMNYIIGLVLKNDIICKTLSSLLGLMTIAIIAYLCKHFFNDKSLILWSLLIFYTFPVIIANMPSCDVDIPQALWTVLAMVVLENYFKEQKIQYLLISSIIAGMALQTKIFGVFVIPVVLGRLIIRRRSSFFSFTGMREAALLMAIPLLMGLPWYVKSYVYNQTILSINHSSIVGQGLGYPLGIKCVSKLCYWFVNIVVRTVSSPWSFSIFPGQHQGNTFGPLIIAVLPFLFFISVPKQVRTLLIAAGIFFIQILIMEMWFIQGGTSIRYSMFIFIICAPIIAWTVNQLSNYPIPQKVLRLIIICTVCLGSLIFIKRYNKEWISFLTFQTRHGYYNRLLPEYALIRTINTLPKGKIVMPIYNYSDYLLDVPYITAYKRYNSLKEMKEDFKQKNIGYIFANDKLNPSENRNAFPELKEKVCIDSANGFYLFKLIDTSTKQ